MIKREYCEYNGNKYLIESDSIRDRIYKLINNQYVLIWILMNK